jgi:hypothetical protein
VKVFESSERRRCRETGSRPEGGGERLRGERCFLRIGKGVREVRIESERVKAGLRRNVNPIERK